jgi:hypothetical protein
MKLSLVGALKWLGVFAYIAYVVTQHENVQQWLGPVANSMGRSNFYNIMGTAGAIMTLATVFLFWRWSGRSAAKAHLRVHMTIALLAALVSFALLTVNNAEIIHYPQYAFLSFMLFPYLMGVGETVAWCAIIGLIDEGYQYFVLHPKWGVPWDFNDVTLDICGGWVGAILIASAYRAIPQASPRWWNRVGILSIVGAIATLPLLTWLNLISLYDKKGYVGFWFSLSRFKLDGFWFFDESWGPRMIHLLTPVEGPIVFLVLVLSAAMLDRKFAFTK